MSVREGATGSIEPATALVRGSAADAALPGSPPSADTSRRDDGTLPGWQELAAHAMTCRLRLKLEALVADGQGQSEAARQVERRLLAYAAILTRIGALS